MNIEQKLLTPNEFSRPQTKLKSVKGVVIHWVANPTSTAINNRNFFERRKDGKSGYGSAHYIIGLKGEVIQCLPDNELAYHVGSKTYLDDALRRLSKYPNDCTIGIEFCHPDDTGKPNLTTYATLIKLSATLLKKHKLSEKDLWTHQSIVGWKQCPKYYVEHPSDWAKFKKDVGIYLKGLK